MKFKSYFSRAFETRNSDIQDFFSEEGSDPLINGWNEFQIRVLENDVTGLKKIVQEMDVDNRDDLIAINHASQNPICIAVKFKKLEAFQYLASLDDKDLVRPTNAIKLYRDWMVYARISIKSLIKQHFN